MKTVMTIMLVVMLLLRMGSAAQGVDGYECDPSCATCQNGGNPNYCITCTGIRVRWNPSAAYSSCDCPTTHYRDSSNNCQTCSVQCVTCWSSATYCLSCHGSNRNASSTCACNHGYFENASNICQICHYSCSRCTSGSGCTTCNALFKRTLIQTGQPCGCVQKYYDSGVANCSTCHTACVTCNGVGQHNCLSCNATDRKVLSGTSCVPACQVSCLACVENFTERCATCDPSTTRSFNATNQQCQCPAGDFDDRVNAACATCHYTCTTCLGTATNCTSCPALRHFINGSCPCEDKYYDSSNLMQNQSLCTSCRYYCATCTHGTNCSTCNSLKNRYLNSSTKQCDCGVGYYDDEGNHEQCALCDYRCLTCSGLSVCLTCSSGWGRENPAANCTCLAGSYDNGVSVCVKCHYTCATCTNGSQCVTCSNSTFRALINATKQCSCLSGYYDPVYDSNALTPQACLTCKAGCASCTTSLNCQLCTNTSYYVNATTYNCAICHSSCLTCSGPLLNNCLTCTYPKFLTSQMCVEVVCPFGKYVDLLGSCSACSELHENSLSCNIDEPLSCGLAFKLSEQECKTCNQVTGYALSNGECKEICGDGYLIGYQCDDGNNLNGDGCSDSCSIQRGWRCDVVSNRSSCTLTEAVELLLLKIVKFPRRNRIRITLQLSLPIRLSSNNFAVSFTSLPASAYSTVILPQSQAELLFISFEIEYKASLQNQRLTLSYSQSRRLHEVTSYGKPRLLASVSFSTNLEVTAFPPANYISTDSYGFYDRASAAIFVLSLVLLFLNLVVAPKKYALHSVSVAWLVPYLYFTVFYSTGYSTDWLSPMASNLKYIALYFGFSFGPCCSNDSILGTTSEVVSNAGAVIVILLVIWLTYLTIFLFTLRNKAEILVKALRMTKYLLLTFHAFFFYQLIFASFNAFTKYANSNRVDGANLFIALVILIGTSFFLAYLWYVTCRKFEASRKAASQKSARQPSEKKVFADIQQNVEHDESNIVIKMSNAKNELTNVGTSIHALSIPDSASEEIAEEESCLPFDFCTLYSAHRLAKYFLPVLLTKVFLFALFSAALTANPFAMLLLHLLLSTAFLVFVCAVRPFESRLTQAKIIVIEVLLIALQLPFTIYQFYGLKSVYLQSVESYLIVEIIFLLLAAVFFTIAEQCVIWKALLSQLCGNLGVEGVSRKVKDIPAPSIGEKKETIKIEEMLQRPIVQKAEEEKPQQQQFKESDMVRFVHSAGFAQNFRRERTRTAAEKTSQEQFA